MRTPEQLKFSEAINLIEQVRRILWCEDDGKGGDFWTSEKEWDQDTLDRIAEVLRFQDLEPEDVETDEDKIRRLTLALTDCQKELEATRAQLKKQKGRK